MVATCNVGLLHWLKYGHRNVFVWSGRAFNNAAGKGHIVLAMLTRMAVLLTKIFALRQLKGVIYCVYNMPTAIVVA